MYMKSRGEKYLDSVLKVEVLNYFVTLTALEGSHYARKLGINITKKIHYITEFQALIHLE